MILVVLLFTHLAMFFLGGLVFWYLTDDRVAQERRDSEFARRTSVTSNHWW